MTRKTKKITLFTLTAVIIIIAVFVALRYFPLNRIMSISTSTDKEYLNREQITSLAPNSLFYDFEVDQESGNTNGLNKEIAHSGKFSAKVFGKNSYSIAIERTAGEIGLDNLDAVSMSSWAYIFPTGNEITGAFVFTVNNDLGVNICWKGITVTGKDVPLGKWFKISGLFDISDLKLKENYKIQIYFWNNSNSDILVDDFYIVFGGQKKRRGDTTYVDMTRETAFQPRFNFPPFPVHWLEKQEINNHNSTFLVNSGEMRLGEISPGDKIFNGRFTGCPDGKDDLLVIKADGIPELYHFCSDMSGFVRIKTKLPADLASAFGTGKVLAGRFTGSSSSGLLILTNEDLVFGSFDLLRDPCTSERDQIVLYKTAWKIPAQKCRELGFSAGSNLITCDLDGDKSSELLAVEPDGSWKLWKLNGNISNPLSIVASGKENPLLKNKVNDPEFKVISGRFLTNFDRDVILVICKSGINNSCSYSMIRYDAVSRQLVSFFAGTQQFAGKTIGPDTLRPGDEFFTGNFDFTGKTSILKYSREWRFDLKEIRFNDTTFQVFSGLDFRGYEKDHNPKYFDVLRIVPGTFLDPGYLSLLVIGRSCKTRDTITGNCIEFRDLLFLPNTLQFYSFRTPGK